MIRLQPMTEEQFQAYLERAVVRRAERSVSRGLWRESAALEAGREAIAEWLPQGLHTPHHYFVHLVDERTGKRVGEAAYSVTEKGGKVQFWIDWLCVDPEQRRKGYATEALQLLGEKAAEAGADRVGLDVFADNPVAQALYARLGFVPLATAMVKLLDPPSSR